MVLAGICIFARSLCLNYSQWQSILAKQNIISVSLLPNNPTKIVYLVFFLNVCVNAVKLPAKLFQIRINIEFTGHCLTQISHRDGTGGHMHVFFRTILILKLLYLSSQRLDFFSFLPDDTFLLSDSIVIQLCAVNRNCLFIKHPLFIIIAIAVINPLNKVKQYVERINRITF